MDGRAEEIYELNKLAEGDVAVFCAIYSRYLKAVYANVLKLVRSQEHAEEIVQDVFVALWQNRSKLRLDQSIAGWLFVVSYNKACTFLKKKVAYAIDFVEDYQVYEGLQLEEDLHPEIFEARWAAVEEAIETLSPRRREVLKLCRIEGKTKEEAASLLGISPETVKEYLKESYKIVRSYIGTNYPNGIIEMVILFAVLSKA